MQTSSTRFGGNATGLPAVQAEPVLPAPAPLPGLATAFSRRAALFGAVSATGFLGAAAAGSAGVLRNGGTPTLSANDARLMVLAGAYAALDATVSAMHSTDPGYGDLIDRYQVLEDEMAGTDADSMAGVLAKARALRFSVMRDCEEMVSLSVADDVWRLFGGRDV